MTQRYTTFTKQSNQADIRQDKKRKPLEPVKLLSNDNTWITKCYSYKLTSWVNRNIEWSYRPEAHTTKVRHVNINSTAYPSMLKWNHPSHSSPSTALRSLKWGFVGSWIPEAGRCGSWENRKRRGCDVRWWSDPGPGAQGQVVIIGVAARLCHDVAGFCRQLVYSYERGVSKTGRWRWCYGSPFLFCAIGAA